MGKELTLAEYADLVRRRWRVIAVVTLAALAVAVFLSLITPQTYTARTVLAAVPQKYAWRLDAAFQTITEDLRLDRRVDYSALIGDKLLGREMARRVIARFGDGLPAGWRDPASLQSHVDTSNRQSRLLYLDVEGPSPAMAQALAAAWVEEWVAEVELRYGQSSDLAKFQAELAQGQEDFDKVRAELETFQSRTGLGLELGGELTQANQGAVIAALPPQQQLVMFNSSALADYEGALARLDLLKGRVEAVIARRAPFTDLPLEILGDTILSQRGVLSQARLQSFSGDPAGLLALLEGEADSLRATIEQLRAESETLQRSLAADIQERNRLLREYQIRDEAVKSLTRKLTEIEIQKQVAGPLLAVLQPAGLPGSPSSPNWIVNLGVALALGLVAGTALTILTETHDAA